MAIRFLESFGWPSTGVTGNPFLDRGFVNTTETGSITTSQTAQRPGSGGAVILANNNRFGSHNIRFPIQLTPTATIGFAVSHLTAGSSTPSTNINIGTATTGATLSIGPTSTTYTLGNVSGTIQLNLITRWAYFEVQVTSTLIILRINNAEVARRAGSGFTAGTDFVRFTQSGEPNLAVSDVYLSDDAIFRGDCYVRLLELTATVDNTGVKEGPAATIHEGLKVFSGVDFVTYDESGEGTTVELQDIADNPSNIHGVMIRYSTAKTETDSVTAVPYVRVDNGAGYVQADLPTHQPGPNYAPVEYPLTLDPTDNGAWTKSKVNSLRVGLRRL